MSYPTPTPCEELQKQLEKGPEKGNHKKPVGSTSTDDYDYETIDVVSVGPIYDPGWGYWTEYRMELLRYTNGEYELWNRYWTVADSDNPNVAAKYKHWMYGQHGMADSPKVHKELRDKVQAKGWYDLP